MGPIGGESIWFDEAVSWRHLDAPSLGAYLEAARRDDPVMTPVYFVAQYGWARFFGSSAVSMRMLSVLSGLGTIALVYAWGRRMYGGWGGWVAGFCVAAVNMHIYFTQEIRMYSLAWFWAACSGYTLWRWRGQERFLWLALNWGANGALLFTHYFGALLVATEAAYLLTPPCPRRRWLLWCAGNAAGALALCAWIATMNFEAAHRAAAWIPGVTRDSLFDVVYWYTGAFFLRFRPSAPGLLLAVAPILRNGCLALFAGAIFAGVWRVGRAMGREGVRAGIARSGNDVFALATAFAPVALLAGMSALFRPVFLARYAGFASFGLYLLAGGAVGALGNRYLRAAAAGGIAALLGAQALGMYFSCPVRTDWQGAASLIAREDPAARVVVCNYLDAAGISAASKTDAVFEQYGTLEKLEAKLATPAYMRNAFWVVKELHGGDDPMALETLFARRHIECRRYEFNGRYYPLLVYHCAGAQ